MNVGGVIGAPGRRRWRVPADRKRLTHVEEEDSGADVIDGDASLERQEGGVDGGGTAPPGAMPTGVYIVALRVQCVYTVSVIFIVDVLKKKPKPHQQVAVHLTVPETVPSAGFTGFVVGVIEEGRRPYVVTIPADETAGLGSGGGGMATVVAVPMDARVPKIRIKTRQLKQVPSAGVL